MIKKVMNFYWTGCPMSWLRYMTLYSFRKLNPEWEINLHSDKYANTKERVWHEEHNRQDFFDYIGGHYGTSERIAELSVNEKIWEPENTYGLDMNTVCSSQRSNFFKWDMLSKGCYYSDMDIVFIKPMTDIYEQTKDMDAGLTFKDYFSIGFMFGADGNALFKAIYENACRTFFPLTYQGAGVETLYKKWENIEQMRAMFPQIKIFNIPMRWFYSLNHMQVSKIFEEQHFNELPQDTYGVHWYAGSPLAQKFNNEITEKNLDNYYNTLVSALKTVL